MAKDTDALTQFAVDIPRRELETALSLANMFVPSRSPNPALLGIKLSVSPDSALCIESHDDAGAHFAYYMTVHTKVKQNTQIILHAKMLVDIVSAFVENELDIMIAENLSSVRITCGTKKSTLRVYATAFPNAYKPFFDPVKIPYTVLANAFNNTNAAFSEDTTRPILNGMYLHITDEILTAAGADGYRISEYIHQFDNPLGIKQEFFTVIPGKILRLTMRALAKCVNGLIDVYIEDGNKPVVFDGGNMTIALATIDGVYPDFSAFIPRDYATVVTIKRAALHSAFRFASVMAKTFQQLVILDINDNKITIKSLSKEFGNSESTVETQITGPNLRIGINAQHVLDILQALDSSGELNNDDDVLIHFNGKQDVVLLTCVGTKELRHVVMPVASVYVDDPNRAAEKETTKETPEPPDDSSDYNENDFA